MRGFPLGWWWVDPTHSASNGRVSAGSMTSSTRNDSAVRKGERTDSTRSGISALVRAVRRHAAAVEPWVARQHRDRPSVEARQRGHRRRGEAAAELEDAARVEDDGQQATDVVRRPPVLGYEVAQRLVPTAGVVLD